MIELKKETALGVGMLFYLIIYNFQLTSPRFVELSFRVTNKNPKILTKTCPTFL